MFTNIWSSNLELKAMIVEIMKISLIICKIANREENIYKNGQTGGYLPLPESDKILYHEISQLTSSEMGSFISNGLNYFSTQRSHMSDTVYHNLLTLLDNIKKCIHRYYNYRNLNSKKKVVAKPTVSKSIPVVPVSPDENNIVFMFLGGLPKGKQMTHWNKFLQTIDDSFYIVVHPMKLEGYVDNEIMTNPTYKGLYENNKLIIVDRDSHVRTAWATFSLVAATLLMMETVLMKLGNNFKKYVLVSNTDMPLYNYSMMKKILSKDNKSWFSFNDSGYGNLGRAIKPFDYQGGSFDINAITFASQWCAIDQTHIPFFFEPNTLNQTARSYRVKTSITCGEKLTDVIESNNKKLQRYIDSFVGSELNEIDRPTFNRLVKNGYCIPSDEIYFGAVILDNINHQLRENIQNDTVANLEARADKGIIPSDGTELTQSKNVFANWGRHTKNNRIWHDVPRFNPGKLKYRIKLLKVKDSDIKSPDYLMVYNNKVYQISSEDVTKIKEGKIGLEEYINMKGGYYSHHDEFINITDLSINNNDYSNIYCISTTYTDWSLVNVSPSNIFRDFKSKLFSQNGAGYSSHAKDILGDITELNTQELLAKLNNQLASNPLKGKGSIVSNFAKRSRYHPAEYLTYTLRELINAYNVIVFFDLDVRGRIDDLNDTDFNTMKQMYLHHINKNLSNGITPVKLNNKDYYYINDVSNPINSQRIGYTINSHILNNALMYGGLFIRKVMDDSMNSFTDILMTNNKHPLIDNITTTRDVHSASTLHFNPTFVSTGGSLNSLKSNTILNYHITYQ